jgi:alpha-tubulin suppressor-like RCC1 family protein
MKTLSARRLARAALLLGLTAGLGAGSGTALAKTVPTQSGAVAWGADNAGQLGVGAGAARAAYGGVADLGSGVAQVSAGYEHGLALKTDGTVWAWGANDYGELGTGANAMQSLPVQVPGLAGVTQVAAGSGVSLALRSDGTVWQWGGGVPQARGTAYIVQPIPMQVPGLVGVTAIAAGWGFDLALRSDGTVWAWGCNTFGQLGVGQGFTYSAAVPVRDTGLRNVIAITAGLGCAAAIERRSPYTTLTSLLAWGMEATPGTDQLSPVQVDGIGAPEVASVSAGDGFFVALGSDGSVWAWGQNRDDDLGVADVTGQPVEVRGPGSGITQVSAGLNHALALRSDGTVLAWGDDTSGQLGDGTTSLDSTPVQVTGLTGATQVSAGDQFSLAIQRTLRLALGTRF